MLILKVDLASQMLAQRLNAVGTEVIVEIPETRLEQPHGNPGLSCFGSQPFCRALPRRIAVDGSGLSPRAMRFANWSSSRDTAEVRPPCTASCSR